MCKIPWHKKYPLDSIAYVSCLNDIHVHLYNFIVERPSTKSTP